MKEAQENQAITLNPETGQANASIIWLHGLGADGQDFVPIVNQLDLDPKIKLRFIFPHAPIRPITVNGGMRMRAWYDIEGFELSSREDQKGVEDSRGIIESLIENEIVQNIPSERIILGGFSQGGALALHAGLRYPKQLAGLIVLSSYLPLPEQFMKTRTPENQSIPIFMAHGLFDPIVPLMLGEHARQQLLSVGYSINWHTYPMPHTVLPQEIQDIGRFINKTLNPIL